MLVQTVTHEPGKPRPFTVTLTLDGTRYRVTVTAAVLLDFCQFQEQVLTQHGVLLRPGLVYAGDDDEAAEVWLDEIHAGLVKSRPEPASPSRGNRQCEDRG